MPKQDLCSVEFQVIFNRISGSDELSEVTIALTCACCFPVERSYCFSTSSCIGPVSKGLILLPFSREKRAVLLRQLPPLGAWLNKLIAPTDQIAFFI